MEKPNVIYYGFFILADLVKKTQEGVHLTVIIHRFYAEKQRECAQIYTHNVIIMQNLNCSIYFSYCQLIQVSCLFSSKDMYYVRSLVTMHT